MYCPSCYSTSTKIVPNTNHYTCIDCHSTFGFITGSEAHCPRCFGSSITVEDGYFSCDDCGCPFTSIADNFVRAPYNFIFPTRSTDEFFIRKIYEL